MEWVTWALGLSRAEEEDLLTPEGIVVGSTSKGTYVMYPYQESRYYRALVLRLDIRYIQYLITTRVHT